MAKEINKEKVLEAYKQATKKGTLTEGQLFAFSQFVSQFTDIIESVAYRNKVTLIKVNPAWTSWLAEKLFCPTMKLNVHIGASYVIARRGQGYKDTVKSL